MPEAALVLRTLLALCAAGMAVLAASFLRMRQLPLASYLAWGLLAIGLPYLGPFLVILAAPGRPRRINAWWAHKARQKLGLF